MYQLLALLFKELLEVIANEFVKILKESDKVSKEVEPDLSNINTDISIDVGRFAGL